MSEISCASCGASMLIGTKFCVECGTKIVEAPEPVLAAVATASPAAPAQARPQIQYQQQQPAQAPPIHPQPYAKPFQAVPDAAPAAAAPVGASAQPEKPMGLIAFVLTMLVFMVPVVGIVLAFVWALGKNTGQNRKNFATAQLIVWGMLFAGVLAWYIINFNAVNELVKVILS